MSTPAHVEDSPAHLRFFYELREQHRLAGHPDLTALATTSALPATTVRRVLRGVALPSVPALRALLEAMDLDDHTKGRLLLLHEMASREAHAAAERADERPAPDWRVPVPAAGEPDPVMFSTVQEFVAGLEAVRTWAGEPSLRRLEERSERLHRQRNTAYGKVLRRSTICDMLNASVLPQMEKVRHYLQICGVRDIDAWVYTWRRIRTMEKAALRGAA
ncbi:hypothetical protein ACFWP2_19355 [Kitasatospora sp. NPDC058444]|uniref:hypothetical protein n=1 Tax=Kitasatospora sp. NPDC058444 TaxID=3346504 RepID=UPI003653EFFE